MDIKKIFDLVILSFDLFYGELKYEINLKDNNTILIKIFDVNPSPIYNPMDFEPEFKVFKKNESIGTISTYDFFYTFYKYFPDYVLHLEFELYPYPLSIMTYNLNSPFKVFNFIEEYRIETSKIQVSNIVKFYD